MKMPGRCPYRPGISAPRRMRRPPHAAGFPGRPRLWCDDQPAWSPLAHALRTAGHRHVPRPLHGRPLPGLLMGERWDRDAGTDDRDDDLELGREHRHALRGLSHQPLYLRDPGRLEPHMLR
jgi:hypothetical protein